MSNKSYALLSDEFSTYQEATEFWNTHDKTGYSTRLKDVDLKAKYRTRHFQLTVEEDIIKALRKKARELGTSVECLANEILRERV